MQIQQHILMQPFQLYHSSRLALSYIYVQTYYLTKLIVDCFDKKDY